MLCTVSDRMAKLVAFAGRQDNVSPASLVALVWWFLLALTVAKRPVVLIDNSTYVYRFAGGVGLT